MRLAIISDIHGNRLALEAVLEDIARRDIDRIVNLGDIVSGPLEPGATAELLMARDIPTVRGNHERALSERAVATMGKVDRFAHGALAPRHRDWLGQLPAMAVFANEIFLCHGTPRSDDDPWLDGWWDGRSVVTPDEAAVTAAAEGFDYPVLLCGHTHIPRAVRLRDGRLIVNPGSVGLQLNHGSPDARYATLEKRGGIFYPSFHAVPYDHEAAARCAEANGFPQWRAALASGWAGAGDLF